MKTLGLFFLTAIAEILGCYLPTLWLNHGKSVWLLLPAIISLAIFSWLLTLHPAAAGRVYAAYGGVYIGTAILWLWIVEGITPTAWDIIGSAVTLLGMSIIMFGNKIT
ncbi:YnfA family protein [Aquella oligotrophica]|uniref:YnfA family protein n=1 Tax=Aquella oligotrophica TaxID=2067065 RepID=A0A2I7N9N1_9NEIS|nr:YnfA family protein [Aquella oligotrophica]